ncbi:putative bifunctional diguanylate cyclase/phosphodiesterase [Kineococcus esterisolvens]|uniref:putative bifunctional diguanylate cyclase/phosphodiesterase n=1 Tax=unclassified Kineococcus TaxID=2621656 RepID=UPI003D7DBB13
MRSHAPATGPAAARRLPFRITRRVFWDLAVYMVGLGLGVGAIFPPFAVLLGVPDRYADRSSFQAACLVAGFLVGAVNYALCRAVVGGRLAVLTERLRAVAGTIARGSRGGDWSPVTSARIEVDSDDQLGTTATAFNDLLDALEAGEHFRSLVRNASDVITVVDPAGTITYQTPSVGWVLGHRPASLDGTDFVALVHDEDRPAFRAHLSGVLENRPQPPSVVCRVRHRDGSWRWAETVAGNLLSDPAVAGVVLTTRDVSDRRQLEERLRTQAYHDPLTGLPNRTLFMERLRTAEREGEQAPRAVLFLDLDDLKAVNDGLGHDSGDALLQAVTARLGTCVEEGDVLARLSGDEFAVLLSGARAAEAGAVAERVLESLREPVRLLDRYVHTGISIGIATSATCAASGIGLLRAADVAMYVAKSTGKGRCEVFQPAHHAAELDRERLRADLHRALDEQQFTLAFQPIVELGTGRIDGFEALLRWHHPQRGMVPPADFVPLAEENALIVPIGRWVLQEACGQAARWQAEHCARLKVNVNVSARQFQHPTLVRDITEVLAATGLDPHLLTLEITETLLVQDTSQTAEKLREIKALGVRIALDDFGTGYSSLSYLRRFPIDVLKVDKSFIDGVADNPEDRTVTGAVVQLGRTLALTVVAEGIESAEQVSTLVQLGCPLGQGYRFSRPVSATEASRLVGERLLVGALSPTG